MRYLLKLSKALGDLAIDFSLLHAIANHDKDCHIEVLAAQPNHELLAENPSISKLHVRPKSKIADHMLQFKLLYQRWDVVLISRTAQPLQLFYRLANAPYKRSRYYYKISRDKPEVLIRLSMLEALFPDVAEKVDSTIHFNHDRKGKVLNHLGIDDAASILTVSPGASVPEKMWHKDNFVSVINAVKSIYDCVITVGSKNESALCEYVASKTGAIAAAGVFGLLDVCALLSQSSLHIGNDSGLGHMAAGVGARCVVIGDSYGMSFKPWGQRMLPGNVKDISVEEVLLFLESTN